MSAKKYSLINIILWRGLKERGSRKLLSSYSTSRVFTQSYLFILKHHHHILGFNSYSVTVVKLQVLEFHLVFPLPNWLFSTKVSLVFPLPKFSSIGISLPILRYLVAYLGNVCCLPSSDFSIEGALPPLLGLLWWCRLCFMLLIFILRLENSRPGSLRDDLSRVEVEMSSLIWGEIENE